MLKINTQVLEDYLRENKMSKTEFCKKCKISPATLKKIFEEDETLSVQSKMKVARIVGKDLDVIFSE